MKFYKGFSFLIFFLPISLVYFSIRNYKPFNISISNKNSLNLERSITDGKQGAICNTFSNKSLIQDIKIKLPKSKAWQTNIIEASIFSFIKKSQPFGSIKDQFKKRFDAFVYYENNNDICKNKAKIRISGDGKDHIQLIDGNPISSLDVEMNEGSINGVKRFKLFLPQTKGGNNEIFVANLFSEFGLLSPRTRLINVEINNMAVKMIFQEKLAKELLDNYDLRESALIKITDSLMRNLRSNTDLNFYFNSMVYPSVVNEEWLSKGAPNLKIGIRALNLFSKALQESSEGFINQDIPFNISTLSNTSKNSQISKDHSFFSLLSIISRSLHLNYKHNRKYYYDNLNDSLIPVYYDAGSDILNSKNSFSQYLENSNWNNNELHLAMITKNKEFYDFPDAFNRLQKLDIVGFQKRLEKLGLEIPYEKMLSIKSELIDNLNLIYNLNQKIINNPLLEKKFIKEANINDQKFKRIIQNVMFVSGNEFDNLRECEINSENCQKITLTKEEFLEISKGNYKFKGKTYFYFNKNNKSI